MLKTKHRKPFSRLLAVLMSLAMVLTLIPATAMAEETSNGGMVLSKTATLEDDGTYTIELSAYATGTTTTITEKSGVPLDIVLVLDQSGSMTNSGYVDSLKTAVTKFVNSITANAKEFKVDHRIAIVGFGSGEYATGSSNYKYNYANTELFIGSKQYNYSATGKESTESEIASTQYGNAFQTVTDTVGAQNLKDSIASYAAYGGTRPEYGIEMANGIFNANNNTYEKEDGSTGTRKRIMVVFTDGKPGETEWDANVANAALKEAYKTKNTYDATVYTVGLYSSASTNVTTFMNYLSSNYPTAQSMSNTTYSYNPVYSVSINKKYYVQSGNDYVRVSFSYYYNKWYDEEWNSYTPKRSETSNGIQFYERVEVTTAGPGQADTKYYMTTSNSAELEKIFTNISEDIQNPSTSVTLNADSVMRDVLAAGFKLPKGYNTDDNITIKTVAGTTTDGTSIVWDADVNVNPFGITASVDGQNINITGFDYSSEYIAPSHDGKKLMVTIKGVEATDEAVINEQVDTNANTSGIYAASDAESCIPFPQPKTILTSKSYVLDYAKPVTVSSSDWKQNTLTRISGDMSKAAAEVSAKYGTVTNNGNNTVTYSPKTTNWNGYDSFYAFGKTADSTILEASANKVYGNLWTKVSVIPANNVYYEDDFITTSTDGTTSTGTVGIKYTGEWKIDGTSAANTETANNVIHGGWVDGDAGLSGDTDYSDGTAHKMSAGATATFTFTGKGVDIYSRTDMTTGTVTANLYRGTEAKKANISKALIVDNKSADEKEYYQIPTLSFSNLEYGTYTVKITVTNQVANRTTYYLDGIRVYNPVEEDDTVKDAYKTEVNAVFTQVRDLLQSGYTAFIDEGNNSEGNPTGESTIGDYTVSEIGKIAPKNEIYLSGGQYVTLKTDNSGSNYYIGLKAPKGATKAEISNGTEKSEVTVGHSTDLYYQVVPNADGCIVIKNTGDNLLSITKLRTTGEAGTNGVALLSDEEALAAVASFRMADYVAYQSETIEEETPSESEGSEITETEEPEQDETGDVVIENPEEPEETPSETQDSSIGSWIKDLLNGFKNLFGR